MPPSLVLLNTHLLPSLKIVKPDTQQFDLPLSAQQQAHISILPVLTHILVEAQFARLPSAIVILTALSRTLIAVGPESPV